MAGIVGAAAAVSIFVRPLLSVRSEAQVTPAVRSRLGVACLGRIQPEDGTITFGARSLSGQPSLVAELRVKEGDDIKAGEIVAILNSRQQLEGALRQSEARIKVRRPGETR